MVVKIRFGRGPLIARRSGKNSRIARLASSLLTLCSTGCVSFGMWRLSSDLGWAGDFVFRDGILSHWQVWVGAAAAIQYSAWRLLRYARNAPVEVPQIHPATEPAASLKAAANV
jgi:hypothetical protein